MNTIARMQDTARRFLEEPVDSEGRGEVRRCIWCGVWAYVDEVDRPAYHCDHEVAPTPSEAAPDPSTNS